MLTSRGRAIGVTVAVAALALAGCSRSLGIRGQTQSVAGVGAPQYAAPPVAQQPYQAPASPSFYDERQAVGYTPAPVATHPNRPHYRAPRDNGGGRQTVARRYPTPQSTAPLSPVDGGQRMPYGASGDRLGIGDAASARANIKRAPAAKPRKAGNSARLASNTPAGGGAATDRLTGGTATAPVGQNAGRKPNYEPSGWARWMGRSWRGHVTASGETFDPERLTAAHPSLPLPSYLYVTNRANGRTVLLRVNDRVPASSDRIVAISKRAAALLVFIDQGRAQVDIQYAGPAGKAPTSLHEEAFLREQPWFSHRKSSTEAERPIKLGKSASAIGTGQRPPLYPRWDNTRRN